MITAEVKNELIMCEEEFSISNLYAGAGMGGGVTRCKEWIVMKIRSHN